MILFHSIWSRTFPRSNVLRTNKIWRFAVASLLFTFSCGVTLGQAAPKADSGTAAQTDQPSQPPNEEPDWAHEFLADDPLANLKEIKLQDIRDGLNDPKRRGRVISDHFSRVQNASEIERKELLIDAMKSEFAEVQQQSVDALRRKGQLEQIVSGLLQEYLDTQDPIARNAAIAGLEQLSLSIDATPDDELRALLDLIADPNWNSAHRTAHQIKNKGIDAIPGLLEAFKSDHSRLPLLAEILSDILDSLSTKKRTMYKAAPPKGTPGQEAAVVAKGAASPATKHTSRDVDTKNPKVVTVYYATDRELIDMPRPTLLQLAIYPLMAMLFLFAIVNFFRSKPREERSNAGCLMWLIPPLMALGIVWEMNLFRDELGQYWSLGTGPGFGPNRDSTHKIHYGTCQVSIPPNHQSGELERSAWKPENEQEHVVLKSTEVLRDQAFFEAVRARLASLPSTKKSCFVFIHGFNVDFASAARRTAQIHYDLQFEGVPIFFSWPSQGNIRHYFYDQRENKDSREHIKNFLLDIAEKVNADRIHVIAHSMGADATSHAIADMGEKGQIFDQIILAAPDIDREVFREQLAPKLTKNANRTTLYCSKNDLALIVSKSFNSGTRAGDSSQGALVLQDVDTVDASEVDTDLLGHSYYGDCKPLLKDVHELIQSSLSPKERHLLPWPLDDNLLYWTLPNSETKESDQD